MKVFLICKKKWNNVIFRLPVSYFLHSRGGVSLSNCFVRCGRSKNRPLGRLGIFMWGISLPYSLRCLLTTWPRHLIINHDFVNKKVLFCEKMLEVINYFYIFVIVKSQFINF